jgi:hypothetical protein
MGIKVAVDVFQEVMTELFSDLDYVRVYLNNILIVDNGSLEDHMHKVSICLEGLEKAGFKANVRESLFAVEELEYLRFWLTRSRIVEKLKGPCVSKLEQSPMKYEVIGGREMRIALPRTRNEQSDLRKGLARTPCFSKLLKSFWR